MLQSIYLRSIQEEHEEIRQAWKLYEECVTQWIKLQEIHETDLTDNAITLKFQETSLKMEKLAGRFIELYVEEYSSRNFKNSQSFSILNMNEEEE